MYMETDFNSLGSEVNGYTEVSGYKRLGMLLKKLTMAFRSLSGDLGSTMLNAF